MSYRIRVCQGVNCSNFLSEDLFRQAEDALYDYPDISVEKRGCANHCTIAPNVEVINEETGERKIYHQMDSEKMKELIEGLKNKKN